MAGLIQDEMQQGGGELTPDKVASEIKMPPELQEAYERVVLAGMKIMFSKETNEKVIKSIQGPGPIAKRLGVGIAGLIATLFQQSNKTMPPQLIIPAGTNLLMQAADFLKRGNIEKITDKDIGDAMQVMLNTVLDMFGVDPMKMRAALDSFDPSKVQQQGAQPQAAPAQPQGAMQ